MKYIFILLLGCLLAGSGCNLINPKESTPTYIHIDSFSFIPGDPLLGSSSHKITSIFVYYNDAPVGVFDLPANFPVMASGNGVLTVLPSVTLNGLSDFQEAYPYYNADTFSFNASPSNTITHEPSTKYSSNTKVTIVDDFDANATYWYKFQGDTGIVQVTDAAQVFEGAGSGGIYFVNTYDSSENFTIATHPVPTSDAYVEFDYKSNMNFGVGVYAFFQTIGFTPVYVGISNTNGTWQHFYISLNNFFTAGTYDNFKIGIKAVQDPAVSNPNTYVLFDNFKIVESK